MKLKSVTRSLSSAIIALLVGSILKGETVLVTQSSSPCWALHILTVYQRGSDVIVTKHVERLHIFCIEVIELIEATLEMDFPSIALREVDIFTPGNGDWQVLYRNGVVENSYNPEWGDGWVDTQAAGYMNIKRYPWIYHSDLGWLKVTEGEIVTLNSRSGTPPKTLSFYLFSADYGWLWTSEFTEKFYLFTDEAFKTIEEITGG